MINIDTSAIMKLYIRETDSKDVSRWIRNNNEEKYLKNEFGATYVDYKEKVPAFAPIGWLLKK